MKIVGKILEEEMSFIPYVSGIYTYLEADQAFAVPSDSEEVTEDSAWHICVRSGQVIAHIKPVDSAKAKAFDLDSANSFIKNVIFKKDAVDLDEYNMGLFSVVNLEDALDDVDEYDGEFDE